MTDFQHHILTINDFLPKVNKDSTKQYMRHANSVYI